MKLDAHGGDLLAMASVSKRDPASLLDFSVNVRPEGAPEFLRAALVRANTGLAAYPSPNAEEALAAAARPIRPARQPLRLRQRQATSSSTPSPAYSKGAAHPAFPSSNRRSANTRWPAALPGWKAARSGAGIGSGADGSLPAICWPACRNALGFGGVSGQSLQPFGAVPHARRMPVPAGRRGPTCSGSSTRPSSNTPGRKPMCRSCAGCPPTA